MFNKEAERTFFIADNSLNPFNRTYKTKLFQRQRSNFMVILYFTILPIYLSFCPAYGPISDSSNSSDCR
uniref:Uncharacterized protein n=1 Tax=Romanomermis culicivorax TaxID=13658 RepID=A0A915L5U3_ROMCU